MKAGLGRFSGISRCVFCFLFILGGSPLRGQQKSAMEDYGVDSTLYACFLRCKAAKDYSTVMQATDTLFRMAGEKGDARMQAAALCTRLDYFYFYRVNRDSILHHVELVKRFARETDQPKYYYFAWSKRLINHYIKERRYNLALYEAERMTGEARQENYPAGIANGYNVLSSIYQTKKLFRSAIENREKEIAVITRYDVDTYNLASSYLVLGRLYGDSGDMEKARKCLEEAAEHIYSSTQEFGLDINYANYHTKLGNYSEAREYLRKARQLADTRKEVGRISYEYYLELRDYHRRRKEYAEALAVQQYIEKECPSPEDSRVENLLIKAGLYDNLGELPKAVELYREYLHDSDSLKHVQENIAAGEYAAVLDVERLNAEKGELQLELRERELADNRRIIFLLGVLLVLCVTVIWRKRILNGRLLHSRQELSEKNRELDASRLELLRAKKRAEEASVMKSEFIQNMSHEIRTPLNHIIGFSRVLSDMSKDNEETGEFVDIIERSSNNLLQLVDDVLTLSDLDSGKEVQTDIRTDATSVCRECIAQVRPDLKPGVSLGLETEQENCCFHNNPKRLSQILTHLLRNAAKFTKKGGIVLRWQRNTVHGCIIFSVTDTGIGIPEDKREAVFERFVKLDPFMQGSGLGLPIGRAFAERMGGSLAVDPGYTCGCRFILTLPLIMWEA